MESFPWSGESASIGWEDTDVDVLELISDLAKGRPHCLPGEGPLSYIVMPYYHPTAYCCLLCLRDL